MVTDAERKASSRPSKKKALKVESSISVWDSGLSHHTHPKIQTDHVTAQRRPFIKDFTAEKQVKLNWVLEQLPVSRKGDASPSWVSEPDSLLQ